jgi:hypothetical protein
VFYQFHDRKHVFANKLNDVWDDPSLFMLEQPGQALFSQKTVMVPRTEA